MVINKMKDFPVLIYRGVSKQNLREVLRSMISEEAQKIRNPSKLNNYTDQENTSLMYGKSDISKNKRLYNKQDFVPTNVHGVNKKYEFLPSYAVQHSVTQTRVAQPDRQNNINLSSQNSIPVNEKVNEKANTICLIITLKNELLNKIKNKANIYTKERRNEKSEEIVKRIFFSNSVSNDEHYKNKMKIAAKQRLAIQPIDTIRSQESQNSDNRTTIDLYSYKDQKNSTKVEDEIKTDSATYPKSYTELVSTNIAPNSERIFMNNGNKDTETTVGKNTSHETSPTFEQKQLKKDQIKEILAVKKAILPSQSTLDIKINANQVTQKITCSIDNYNVLENNKNTSLYKQLQSGSRFKNSLTSSKNALKMDSLVKKIPKPPVKYIYNDQVNEEDFYNKEPFPTEGAEKFIQVATTKPIKINEYSNNSRRFSQLLATTRKASKTKTKKHFNILKSNPFPHLFENINKDKKLRLKQSAESNKNKPVTKQLHHEKEILDNLHKINVNKQSVKLKKTEQRKRKTQNQSKKIFIRTRRKSHMNEKIKINSKLITPKSKLLVNLMKPKTKMKTLPLLDKGKVEKQGINEIGIAVDNSNQLIDNLRNTLKSKKEIKTEHKMNDSKTNFDNVISNLMKSENEIHSLIDPKNVTFEKKSIIDEFEKVIENSKKYSSDTVNFIHQRTNSEDSVPKSFSANYCKIGNKLAENLKQIEYTRGVY